MILIFWAGPLNTSDFVCLFSKLKKKKKKDQSKEKKRRLQPVENSCSWPPHQLCIYD